MAGADPPTTRPDDGAFRLVSAGLAAGRIVIGIALAIAPRAALRALGFARPTATAVAVSRLAGGRDIVLGVAAAAAVDNPERLRAATLANAAVDAGDALTFAASLDDAETRRAALRGLAAAVPAALAGAWVAWRLR
jgi:hypothetical protein